MIKNKEDYKEYLLNDSKSLYKNRTPNLKDWLKDEIWRYQRILRKCEFYLNTNKRVRYFILKLIFRKISVKLGFSISENCFDKGLSIAHYGNIIVNSKARIGENCRIHVGVNIGANESDGNPRIGNNVYIGPGAKIFGDIEIGNNIKIGANAVVNKSFPEGNCTLVGIPARKI